MPKKKFQFNENVCPDSKFCISEQHSMRNFIFDEFILFTEYEEFILFTVSFISCSIIQSSYYQAVSEPTSCLIKYTNGDLTAKRITDVIVLL